MFYIPEVPISPGPRYWVESTRGNIRLVNKDRLILIEMPRPISPKHKQKVMSLIFRSLLYLISHSGKKDISLIRVRTLRSDSLSLQNGEIAVCQHGVINTLSDKTNGASISRITLAISF